MLPDSILPTPEDDIARVLRNYERRLSHLERLERGGWILVESQDLTIASTITFSNIPSTYTHLKMIGYVRDNVAAFGTDVTMRFNADAGANYDYYRENEDGAGGRGSNTAIAATLIQIASITGALAVANTFASLEMSIPHYSNTNNHKICQAFSARKLTNVAVNLSQIYVVGFWRDTAAINTIALLNTFAIGTRVDLYGIV